MWNFVRPPPLIVLPAHYSSLVTLVLHRYHKQLVSRVPRLVSILGYLCFATRDPLSTPSKHTSRWPRPTPTAAVDRTASPTLSNHLVGQLRPRDSLQPHPTMSRDSNFPYETIVSKLYHSHHTHSACKFPLYHRKVACKPVDNSCQPLSPALPRSPPPKLSLSPTNCDYVSPSATEPNQCRGCNRHLTSSFNY